MAAEPQTRTDGRVHTAIAVRGVGKRYVDDARGTTFEALRDVDLDIARGEFVSLIGPSGCGKTTLLKIIDGLLPSDDGEVVIDGRAVRGPGPDRAVVFQSFALLPWLTVHENAAFGLKLRGVPATEAAERVRPLLEMVGLTGRERLYPRQLSGGMQQRVGLARALAVDPSILLMDEPFGSVDAQTRNLLQTDLLGIWDRAGSSGAHKTVVFVTHAMDEAVFLSDRVVIMAASPGRVAEIVSVDLPRPRTEATRADPRFVDLTQHVWTRLRAMITRNAGRDA